MLVVAGCGDGGAAAARAPAPPPDVIVGTPVERDVTEYLLYTGTVEASERVELRARVPGFLSTMNFKPGERVESGDVLFIIDRRQYDAAVEESKAIVRSQEAALDGATRDAQLARDLADQRAGAEIDAVLKAVKRDTIRADLERAKANLIKAELDLDYCTVTSPTAGRITENFVDIGNLVGSDGPTRLAEVVQATPAYIYVDITEADVLRLTGEKAAQMEKGAGASEPGQTAPGRWRPAEAALADRDTFDFKGGVDFVEPQLDTQTGTLRVRTRFENEDERLVPGFFARVRFPLEARRSLLVPEAALLSDQQGRYALVVNAANEVETRRVRLGPLEGDMRVVTEGLQPTDRIVFVGVLKARPGSKVTPIAYESAAAAPTTDASRAGAGR